MYTLLVDFIRHLDRVAQLVEQLTFNSLFNFEITYRKSLCSLPFLGHFKIRQIIFLFKSDLKKHLNASSNLGHILLAIYYPKIYVGDCDYNLFSNGHLTSVIDKYL